MLSGLIVKTLRPNLWYTFDGGYCAV